MNETLKCTHCGALLLPDSPEGLCPRCLVAMNLATQTEIPGEIGPHETAAKKTSPPPLPVADIAKVFPQMEIIECLGRGGMGAVYKARQRRLDRFVALKILSPEKQGNQRFAERFEREARALAKLHHPNIVTVYDFGETQGHFYLLMEFVNGLTLRQLLQTRKLLPAEALAIVPKICEALQYAHEQGIVHRDIKPENILMDKDGRLKIADFGIAKILGEGGRGNLTEEQSIGTPHYMSPEQIEHPQAVDHRADIYSLGVVFYEMLTGELPLGKFPPPSKKVQIDVRLDEIVLRTLEKEPERRYQQASEVKTQVETVAATAGMRSRTAESGRAEAQTETSAVPLSTTISSPLMQLVVLGTMLLFGCLLVLLGMTSHAIGPSWGYFRLGFEILAVAIFAGFLSVVYRDIKVNTPETRHAVKVWIPGLIITALGVAFGLWAPHLLHPASPVPIQMPAPLITAGFANSNDAGQTSSPPGDSIEITSVERTGDQMTVKGKYHLVSRDTASLELHVTSLKPYGLPGNPGQSMRVSKGSGYFELTDDHVVPGKPHVSFYAGGQSFGDVYFNSNTPAAELKKVTIIGLYRADSPEIPKWVADNLREDPSPSDFLIAIQEWLPSVDDQLKTFRHHAGQEFILTASQHPQIRVHLNGLDVTDGDGSFQAFGAKIDPGDRDKLVPGVPYTIQPINISDVYQWTVDTGVSIMPVVAADDEAWSPALKPGEKPDFQNILATAKALTDEGSYEDALQHYLWYFDHSRFDSGQRGVRLSFALSDWIELGRRYPKARQALMEIRDADARQFSKDTGYADLFQEIAGINQYLNNDDATVALFKMIDQKDSQLAGECLGYAENTLLQKGDYKICRKYLGDPRTAFDRIRQSWQQMKRFERQNAARNEEQKARLQAMAKTNSMFAHIPIPLTPPPFADNYFVQQTRQLIEILVATGSKTEAEDIQKQALSALDDPQLRSAITDAEAKVNNRELVNP